MQLGNYPIDMLDTHGIIFYTGLTVIDETTMHTLYALGHQRDTAWKMLTGITNNLIPGSCQSK